MQADFADPFDSPGWLATCTQERNGHVTVQIVNGQTVLCAYSMPASQWDARREKWVKAGSPKP